MLANAVALNLYRSGNVVRPVAAVACVALMVAWTCFSSWAYVASERRRLPLLLADLAIAVGLLLVSPVVKGDGFSASVPGFWVIGALMAWAIHYRWLGGLVAGAALAVADLSVRQEVTQANAGNVFLMLIGGPIVGFMAESLQRMAVERDRAERSAAAAAERARLARAVHDGVLQVLSLMQRRGQELGGPSAELGLLAGRQEVALRNLIRAQDAVAPGSAGRVDLAAALLHLGSRPGVEVITSAKVVDLPADMAAELVAVVSACLDNVAQHVGSDSRAWVLLEAWPDRVGITVRDEGPGILDGRLDAAEAEGRLGVSQSIRGRITDLGGTTTLSTGPTGTEWELVVPRRSP